MECFGQSAAYAFKELGALEEQFYAHKAFKEARAQFLGWNVGEESAGLMDFVIVDDDASADELLQNNTAKLLTVFDDLLMPREVAHTSMIQTLQDLSVFVLGKSKYEATKSSYDEAERLKV